MLFFSHLISLYCCLYLKHKLVAVSGMWQSVVVYVYDCLLYPTRTPNSYFQPNGPGVGGGGGFGGYNQVPQGGGGQHPLSLPTSNFNTNTNNPSTVLSSMTSPPHSISAHNANTVSICMWYCHQAGLETPVCFLSILHMIYSCI